MRRTFWPQGSGSDWIRVVAESNGILDVEICDIKFMVTNCDLEAGSSSRDPIAALEKGDCRDLREVGLGLEAMLSIRATNSKPFSRPLALHGRDSLEPTEPRRNTGFVRPRFPLAGTP